MFCIPEARKKILCYVYILITEEYMRKEKCHSIQTLHFEKKFAAFEQKKKKK